MNATKKNISIQNVMDSEKGSEMDEAGRRMLMGEEFILSSAHSNVDTVRK